MVIYVHDYYELGKIFDTNMTLYYTVIIIANGSKVYSNSRVVIIIIFFWAWHPGYIYHIYTHNLM